MMNLAISQTGKVKVTGALLAGIIFGALANTGIADSSPPTEHKGLTVNSVGEIGSVSISDQLGLTGHKLQLREITIMPGGQIAKHDHATRPGVVKVVKGSWIEGRPGKEIVFSADSGGLLEDRDTVHWFFNRGDEPATAYVCDIVPDNS